MQFRVRWFDAVTRSVRDELTEADSAAVAAERFGRDGAVVLSVQRPMRLASRAPRADIDVAWWCRELRTLLFAGMTVVEALESLQAQSLGPARAALHASLVGRLRQGSTLSAAMQSTGVFPPMLVAGVVGSERTSSLVEGLDEYLRYHDVMERLRKQLVSAAIYPAIVVTLGMAIALFLLLFVMPRFARMYGDLHGSVSFATQAILGFSRLLAEHGVLVSSLAVGLIAAAILAWRSGALSAAALRVAERVPALARQFDEFRLAKLYQSLALMFRGGYTLDDALTHSSALGLGPRLAESVNRARNALASGQRVSSALTQAGLTDAVSMRLLAVGERTGNFDRVLSTIAERHATNFTTFVERASRIVEPVLLLMVALVVGGIVVAMYMPVFDIAGSVR